MKIALTQSGPDAFSLTLGDTDVELNAAGLKTVLVEITRLLVPGASLAESEEEQARTFIGQIRRGNDVGIQKMLLICQHDDLLALLKAGETDKALLLKFYSNMSERSRKIFAEDLVYRFADGLPPGRLRHAVENLARCADQLASDGTLIFEKSAEKIKPDA